MRLKPNRKEVAPLSAVAASPALNLYEESEKEESETHSEESEKAPYSKTHSEESEKAPSPKTSTRIRAPIRLRRR